ncbi:hypothetical protein SAMN04488688_105283 [Paenibacillus sp. cl141a]|nr:hypothetical protein SAMN04488688_105283 [Paenibacillus sp. cl141a]
METPSCLSFSDHLEQGPDFLFGKSRCRFIHDDHFSLSHESFGDFDHLLLSHRTIAGSPIQRKREEEFVHLFLCKRLHFPGVQISPAVRMFFPDKEVFQHGHLRPHIEFLMDKSKAIPLSSACLGLANDTSCPSTTISPLSRACMPVKMFIRVDFPAPFSPIRE